jgi:hypothetical protein
MINPLDFPFDEMTKMASVSFQSLVVLLNMGMAFLAYRELGGWMFLTAYLFILTYLGVVSASNSHGSSHDVDCADTLSLEEIDQFLNVELARLGRRVSPRRPILDRAKMFVEAEMASRGRSIDPVDTNVLANYIVRAPSDAAIAFVLKDAETTITSPLRF